MGAKKQDNKKKTRSTVLKKQENLHNSGDELVKISHKEYAEFQNFKKQNIKFKSALHKQKPCEPLNEQEKLSLDSSMCQETLEESFSNCSKTYKGIKTNQITKAEVLEISESSFDKNYNYSQVNCQEQPISKNTQKEKPQMTKPKFETIRNKLLDKSKSQNLNDIQKEPVLSSSQIKKSFPSKIDL